MERNLIFVYNANTDSISVLVDYAHKVFKPSTYKCELCTLTHHNLGERSAWKKFKRSAKVGMEFMYIRGFEAKFNHRYEYPVILEKTADGFVQLMDKKTLRKIKSVDALILLLQKMLDK